MYNSACIAVVRIVQTWIQRVLQPLVDGAPGHHNAAEKQTQRHDSKSKSNLRSDCCLGSAPFRRLIQNAGVVANQRVGYSRGFASEPLLQPAAEAVPEISRTFFEKSLRQVDSAVL